MLPTADTPNVSNICFFTHIKVVKFSYTWIVSNFSFCGENTGDVLESPMFSANASDELKWQLEIYPKGDEEEDKDHLAVYLRCVSHDGNGVRAQFKITLLSTSPENNEEGTVSIERYSHNDVWGFGRFVSLDLLFDEANGFLTDDKLTLCCEISQLADSSDTSVQMSLETPECNLSTDMEKLFESQKFCDFVLSVNGQELSVHKNILASRSSVFAAMFENEMEEKNANRVEITDVDAEVIKEMLRFVYTGKAPSVKNMTYDLFIVSDKYALEELKVICEKALSADLSVDTASNVLVLADVHSTDQLKARAIDYIIFHLTEVMATSGWKTLIMQHPRLVEEVLRALGSDHFGPPRKRIKLS